MISSDVWKREIGQLYDLRLNWNDKLEVINSGLRLTKGSEEKIDGKLFIPESIDIAEHLKFLVNTTATLHLKSLKNQTDHYEQVADFKREFKCFNKMITDLRELFSAKVCNDPQIVEHYSQLYKLSSNLFSEVVEYKASLKKPENRPEKSFQYNERTELSSIKETYPKRVPLNHMLEAAKAAIKLAEPKNLEPMGYCVKPFLCCLTALSVVKYIVWNPFEKCIWGEVTTRTPLKYSVDDYIDTNKHMQAFQKISRQILNCELITNEVALGFAKLASGATTLNLKNAKFFSEELPLDAKHPQIDQSNLMLLLKAASDSQLCNTVLMSKSLLEWNDVPEFLSKHSFIEADKFDHSVTYIRKTLF